VEGVLWDVVVRYWMEWIRLFTIHRPLPAAALYPYRQESAEALHKEGAEG